MRRTKANRALTFVMAAALLIGSIHGVGAKEQSKDYDAPELTLTQGVTDYDLTEGITYDSEKYTLSVTDTGNFDINVAGDYEISYTLTEKESSVNVTESVENTDSVESTGTKIQQFLKYKKLSYICIEDIKIIIVCEHKKMYDGTIYD